MLESMHKGGARCTPAPTADHPVSLNAGGRTQSVVQALNLLFDALPEQQGYRITLQDAAGASILAQGEMPWPDRPALEATFLGRLQDFPDTPVCAEFQTRLGCRLAALLPDTVCRALVAEWRKRPANIQLKFQMAEMGTQGWFAALPWEFLCLERGASGLPPSRKEGREEEFLVLSRHWHLIRQPWGARAVAPLCVHPIKILIVHADPGTPAYPRLLHSEAEIAGIQKALIGKEDRIVVEVVRYATAEGVKARLKEFAPHILHFVGHGRVRPTGGVLAFHHGAGVKEIYGSELAGWIEASPLRLAVLSACHTASHGSLGQSVAQALLAAGIPAVIAMQLPVRDSGGRAFSAALYRSLAEAGSIVEAVRAGRQALQGFGPDWGAPTLSLAESADVLFDLPTFAIVQEPVPTTLPTLQDLDLLGCEASGAQRHRRRAHMAGESLLSTLERLATLAVRQERYEEAVRWLNVATLAREQMGSSGSAVKNHDYERHCSIIPTNLHALAFAEAWKQGWRMRLERVLDEALQE